MALILSLFTDLTNKQWRSVRKFLKMLRSVNLQTL